MNTSSFLALAAASLLAASAAVNAQGKKVYTWTDENGVVHFVDTPPENPNAVSIDAPEAYRPGTEGVYDQADAAAEAPAETPAEATAEAAPESAESYADQKRKELAADRAKAQATKEEREKVCAEATKQLTQLEPARRVFFTNSQGETERLNDALRVQMIEEQQALVDQNCD